ncbi:MAG: hypothetical protein KF751_04940 [Nitrospira sp.]|nr:hypothetical protein [Nitrospira sp.]
MRGRNRADERCVAESGFGGRPSSERVRRQDIPPKGRKETVQILCACMLSISKEEGGTHDLTGCTEPGTEWTRMAVRMMVPVIELVHDQMRADQDD